VGILGSGMSALAQYLRWQGLEISGSDRLLDAEHTAGLRTKLEAIGCAISPQDGSGVTANTSALIVSSAIEETNADIAAARTHGVPVFHRSDALAAAVQAKTAVAVAGTSGKSSVAAMIFHLLQCAGKDPSLITGANLHALVDSGYVGNAFSGSSKLLVIEADESDGSLVKYHPALSVFLNLSKDHKPVDETLGLFATLAAQSQTVIANADEAPLAALRPSCTFGTVESATYRASVSCDTHAAHVTREGITFSTPFPGRHTALNLLASLCVCSKLGVDERGLVKAAAAYRGLERRFDRLHTRRGVTVIDDYAHNPEKIRAALSAAQSLSPRLHALFQPHGFGPTRFLFDELVQAFRQSLRAEDTLILLPIYYAGGTVQKDISSKDIADNLADSPAAVMAALDREQALSEVASRARAGDVVISMGARDPSLPAFAHAIARAVDTAE